MTPEEIVKRLRQGEREGVDGWWTTMSDAADLIERQAKALEELKKLLALYEEDAASGLEQGE